VSNHINKIGIELNKKKNPLGDTFYCGIANDNYTSVRFFPRGNENDLFNEALSKDSGTYQKPWVMLLHGFHQDVHETIEKARFLIDKQKVNVVLFSWPSRPKPIASFDVSTLEDYIKDFVKSVLFGFGAPSLQSVFLKEIRKWLKDLVTNYIPARKNAEASTTDFYNAVALLDSHLMPRVKDGKLSLFVHSMGNYLLQNTIKDKGRLPIMFTNILLHQADVDAANHATWVPGLACSISKKLYISVNVFDYVLAASNILNRVKLGKSNAERLGQSVRMEPDGAYQGYINGIVEYLDFTDGLGVGIKHEIFTNDGVSLDEPIMAGSNDIDEMIFNLIGRIIRSESKDGLRNKPGRLSAGMSMMPAVQRIHKPKWILEDENLCEEHEAYCLLDSYDDFVRRYQSDAPYDPDLDD
jgi:hypothetical protein